MLGVRDHILYHFILKLTVIYVIFICAVKRTYFPVGLQKWSADHPPCRAGPTLLYQHWTNVNHNIGPTWMSVIQQALTKRGIGQHGLQKAMLLGNM